MTILIVEDEEPTARKLKRLLSEIAPTATVAGMTVSVEETVDWLRGNPAPDLIFLDIELADGQSFEIFNRVSVTSPVIFATAYDEYAIKAFKVNSIDYLLKPIKEEDLRQALTKLQTMRQALAQPPDALQTSLLNLLHQLAPSTGPRTPESTPSAQELPGKEPPFGEPPFREPPFRESPFREHPFRERFLVKQGQRLFSLSVDEVAYFFSRNKMAFLKTRDDHEWLLDYTMDELDRMLEPRRFFRLNRQIIAELRAVDKVHLYFNGKLKVDLQPSFPEEVVVSREKAGEFKVWLGE